MLYFITFKFLSLSISEHFFYDKKDKVQWKQGLTSMDCVVICHGPLTSRQKLHTNQTACMWTQTTQRQNTIVIKKYIFLCVDLLIDKSQKSHC